MPEAAIGRANDQCLDVIDHPGSSRTLQDGLPVALPGFHRCAFRLLGNTADAEDAVQEALLAAYKHIDQFRGESQISTWLTAIVRNCARMQLRKRTRQVHLSLDEPTREERQHFVWERMTDGQPSPEDQCRHSELLACLRECATLLSPTLRRTFQLRVMDGLSIIETSRILGVPDGTVKAQLARARAKIAQHMRAALTPKSRTRQRAAQVVRGVEKRGLRGTAHRIIQHGR